LVFHCWGIVVADRRGDVEYLRQLRAGACDLQNRATPWNVLNQVNVFGYFLADLHPANLYVLPGNAMGYVDFGVIGQLADNVRNSLTRYSWLLFEPNEEAAVRELMHQLA
jgi:hypothetical protein